MAVRVQVPRASLPHLESVPGTGMAPALPPLTVLRAGCVYPASASAATSVAMCPNFISPHKTFFLTFRPIYIRTFWTSPPELLARAQSEVIFSLKPMSAFHLTQRERSPPTDSFEKPRECRGFFTAL